MITKNEQQIIIKQLGLEQLLVKGDEFNFKCHICGDSKKSITKIRGHFYWNSEIGSYEYKCFNCGIYMLFTEYLKEYHPEAYKAVLLESLSDHGRRYHKQNEIVQPHYKINNSEVFAFFNNAFNKKIICDMKNLKNEEAMTYIYNRKIPQNKLKLLFYCENFYSELYIPLKKMIKTVEQEEFEVKFIPRTDPRIFWFIKDRKNNIIGIQGRSILTGAKMRYLTVKITDDVMVGNLENIKLNEPIYVTEGFFDSLFLPNCVSLNCGSFKATVNTLLELKAKHIIVIFDNEPKNEQILKKINEVINLSIQITKDDTQIGVTLLPKNLRPIGKDINEYIKQNISNSKILNIIRDNTHYGMNAKIQLLRWI